jgi:hypothetical protein
VRSCLGKRPAGRESAAAATVEQLQQHPLRQSVPEGGERSSFEPLVLPAADVCPAQHREAVHLGLFACGFLILFLPLKLLKIKKA